MKTILSNGTYQRVSDEVAEHQVRYYGAKYTPKSEWKINVRDKNKSEQVVVAEVKGEKTKSKKAQRREKIKEKQRH
jgi:hypothetical protein